MSLSFKIQDVNKLVDTLLLLSFLLDECVTYGFFFVSDDIELDAQVSAQVSPGQGERYIKTSVFDVSVVRLQRNRIHSRNRISK